MGHIVGASVLGGAVVDGVYTALMPGAAVTAEMFTGQAGRFDALVAAGLILDDRDQAINAAPTTGTQFARAEVLDAAPTIVEVFFTSPVISKAGDPKLGVVIKEATVSKTISSGAIQAGGLSIQYTMAAPITAAAAVTWEYDADTGDLVFGAVVPDISAKTVLNLVEA
jgi:hypothetical protein